MQLEGWDCLTYMTYKELFGRGEFYNIQSKYFYVISMSFGEGKTLIFKTLVFRTLKSKLRKHQKKAGKKLELDNKGGTFAPATANKFFNRLSK